MASSDVRAPENDIEYEELFNAASKGNIKRLEAALLPSMTLLPSMSVDALEADPLYGRGALHIAAQAGSGSSPTVPRWTCVTPRGRRHFTRPPSGPIQKLSKLCLKLELTSISQLEITVTRHCTMS